ncbi:MAG: isochorismate synthase [Longimonas sp.]|uniref:isochorismate synthase n=1 Tax=Longimonas sp. TaxID=2039626 RepID=UPI003976475F
MIPLSLVSAPSDDRIDADAVRQALRAKVRQALQSMNGVTQVRTVSVEVPVAIDPLAWGAVQTQAPFAYWRSRTTDSTYAVVGAARQWQGIVAPEQGTLPESAVARLAPWLDRLPPGVRLWGGARFDPQSNREDAWADFGAWTFMLPRFTLHRSGSTTHLHATLVAPHDPQKREAVLRQVDALRFPNIPDVHADAHRLRRIDRPTRADWMQQVRAAVKAIRNEQLRKVVLARAVDLHFDHALMPWALLHRLQQETPQCTAFGWQPKRSGPAFIGATPERLFQMREDTLHTEAIAGTRPRGATPADDAMLRHELLTSDKDRREHAFVQDAIADALAPLATDVDVPNAPSELALQRKRHLRSEITATLHEATSPLDVLNALHPTPAVGGTPTRHACAFIREHESFDRGWYAGPVGWMTQDAAEMLVAIRSALVDRDTLTLYSGAGIVEGSDPASEWDEIENKLADFKAALER